MSIDATQIATSGADKLFDMGILGVFTVAMMAFIVWIYRSHKDERKEWRDDSKKTTDDVIRSSDKLADAIAQLSRDIHRRGE